MSGGRHCEGCPCYKSDNCLKPRCACPGIAVECGHEDGMGTLSRMLEAERQHSAALQSRLDAAEADTEMYRKDRDAVMGGYGAVKADNDALRERLAALEGAAESWQKEYGSYSWVDSDPWQRWAAEGLKRASTILRTILSGKAGANEKG